MCAGVCAGVCAEWAGVECARRPRARACTGEGMRRKKKEPRPSLSLPLSLPPATTHTTHRPSCSERSVRAASGSRRDPERVWRDRGEGEGRQGRADVFCHCKGTQAAGHRTQAPHTRARRLQGITHTHTHTRTHPRVGRGACGAHARAHADPGVGAGGRRPRSARPPARPLSLSFLPLSLSPPPPPPATHRQHKPPVGDRPPKVGGPGAGRRVDEGLEAGAQAAGLLGGHGGKAGKGGGGRAGASGFGRVGRGRGPAPLSPLLSPRSPFLLASHASHYPHADHPLPRPAHAVTLPRDLDDLARAQAERVPGKSRPPALQDTPVLWARCRHTLHRATAARPPGPPPQSQRRRPPRSLCTRGRRPSLRLTARTESE